ncbi:MAG: hypothetical protein K9L17_10405 [Clostridiales bacterium]|nr:hypothetical protein [Clostridiales bacterium]MCF8023090.1 hypothetical protein [Clostridiales bacterium]
MLSPEQIDAMLEKIMDNMECNDKQKSKLTTSEILVIAGLLGNVLSVDSILVDRDQLIQIVLSGSLKRKTELDKILEKMEDMPFEDVMKGIIDHFS